MLPLGIAFAAILSVADYISEHLVPKKIMANQRMISFAAGVAVAYILLHLFPLITGLSIIKGEILFVLVLAGFTVTHLLEKYMHISHHRSSFLDQSSHIHLVYFFTYNFLIGIVLSRADSQGISDALLFFIPFLLYIVVETLPQKFHLKNPLAKVLYACAPLFGALVATFFPQLPTLSRLFYPELVSLITGTLLYIVIRQSVPSNREGRPLYFVLGTVLYATILLYSPAF